MSNKFNDQFLEAKQDDFDEAMGAAQFGVAKAIINDVSHAGFWTEAAQMELELEEAERAETKESE